MKREIKFRAKSVGNGEWVYGDLHLRCLKPHIHTEVLDGTMLSLKYNIISDTIGQFTGLHDRNGKEVYEGDIVSGDNEQVDKSILLVVKYGIVKRHIQGEKLNLCLIPCFYFEEIESKCPLFPILDYPDKPHGMVVVGNIYDNPELLEKK